VNSNTQQLGHDAAGIQPGQVLLGKYRIERVLGIGGMGVVVAATHITLEERVAIKFLLPQALQNGEATARFLREARSAVRIKSEHVARVTDVGELENGSPYMIMEYLEGADLGALAKQRGALPIDEAIEYVLQACEALAEAHALGIVHRDLKPANLFVATRADGTPSVKVLDFGISKVSGLANSGAELGMTKTTTVMGSPLYMSPEQMASAKDVDARTDIWALGAILYELLTGRVPFQADSITQLCVMILQQQPPPLRDKRPDAPQELQHIVLRCLERDRDRRYANVAEFAHALAPFAPRRSRLSIERVSRVIDGAGLGTSRANPTESVPPGARVAAATGAAWGGTGGSTRSTGRSVGMILIALVALAGVAAAAALKLRPESTEPAPVAADVPAPAAEPSPAPKAAVVVEPVAAALPAPAAPSASAPAVPAPAATAPSPRSLPNRAKAGKVANTVAPARAAAQSPAKKADLYSDRK